MLDLNFIGLFIFLSGYIIGLGSVTVIDILGFLGRKSKYWTEATTRTHKVTKPLIWIGIIFTIIGGWIIFRNEPFIGGIPMYLSFISFILLLNGIFLSFIVSPYLIEREKNGMSGELLPVSWQRKIIIGLILSDICWWGGLLIFVYYIVSRIN